MLLARKTWWVQLLRQIKGLSNLYNHARLWVEQHLALSAPQQSVREDVICPCRSLPCGSSKEFLGEVAATTRGADELSVERFLRSSRRGQNVCVALYGFADELGPNLSDHARVHQLL